MVSCTKTYEPVERPNHRASCVPMRKEENRKAQGEAEMDILVRQKNGNSKWDRLVEQDFENEAALQSILYRSPDIIPIEQLGNSIRKPRLFIKEAGLPGSGNTDLIGVDEEGGITIIECKLASNTEIRRKVIGQVLEYAAYLWQIPYDEFDGICVRAEKWHGKHLSDAMREIVAGSPEDWSEEDFKKNLGSNLTQGDFCLIIAVDALNDELRRVIEFLNSRGKDSPQIHALEMKFFETTDLQVLVPALFGTVPTVAEPAALGNWDEGKFFAQCRENTLANKTVAILQQLYEFSKEMGSITWGRGRVGSFSVGFDRYGIRVSTFTVNTSGQLTFNFGYIDDSNKKLGGGIGNDAIQQFKAGLKELVGLDTTDWQKQFPSIQTGGVLDKEGNLDKFESVITRFKREVSGNGQAAT